MATKQKIRIRLKAFDHKILDQSAVQIVETAERTGALVAGPVPLPTKIEKFSVIRGPFIDKDSQEQFETLNRGGYDVIQLGFEETEDKKLTQAERGHLRAKKRPLGRHLQEMRTHPAGHKVGQRIDVTMFTPGDIVDVIGTSKGKGFA